MGRLRALRRTGAPASKELRLACERHEARLLVVDTLGVANGASEIDRAQVKAFFVDRAAWADELDWHAGWSQGDVEH